MVGWKFYKEGVAVAITQAASALFFGVFYVGFRWIWLSGL